MINMFINFLNKNEGGEMKIMKRALPVIVVITLIISTSGLSFADPFYPLGVKAISASSGTVGGTAAVTVPFAVNLKNISNDATAASVT